MGGFAARTNVDSLAGAVDWTAFETVVDVGGGWGPVGVVLVWRFLEPGFVVRDLGHVVKHGCSYVPEELKGRVWFAVHYVFKTQNIKGADVYLMRHVLYNFPDSPCREILRAQIPGMRAVCCIDCVAVVNVFSPWKL